MIPSTLNVLIKHKEHCNLDSFPLRFGFSFEQDTTVKIKRESEAHLSLPHNNRREFIGAMINPNTNETEKATFVVMKINDEYKMVTAWRNDSDTEYYLSSVMTSLRKSGALTVKDLLAFYPSYINGELREHADLVIALSKNKSQTEIERIKRQSEQTVQEVTEERNKLKLENNELKEANNNLQNLLVQERAQAKQTDYSVNETEANTLVDVKPNVIYKNSPCTQITLGNGQKWYMKTSTFDRNGEITQHALSLIKKNVVVTSWDPLNAPGKWSSQRYFRNIHAI